MWAMQMSITGAAAAGIAEMPRMTRRRPFNVLVNTYLTSDGRWIALSMLQADVYWAGFCRAIGRDDLVDDERFRDASARSENLEACIDELDRTFAALPLAHWIERLAAQEGQWDVLKKVSEVLQDGQVQANRFAQKVDYGNGHELSLVASPVQFDQNPPRLRPAPQFAGDTDEILGSLGWDMDAILEAKIKGAVV
jgi:crotonobetainyl-CoA:carnitine CoA-transferase CaiB-like acyl-CoA transferase